MEYQRVTKAAQKEQSKTPSSSLRQTSLNHLGVHPLLELQRTLGNQAVLNLLRSGNVQIDSTRQAFIETRFGHDFSQIPIHSTQAAVPQTKLKVNQPGDVYEQEADQVAEQVMRMANPEAPVSDDEGKAKNSPTRKQGREAQASAVTDAPSVPPIVHDVLNSGGGQPLDATTRAFMEPRFGHDFSQVRVHTDTKAAESAEVVNALAYTVERDLVFGAGQYIPATSEGRKLVAHELTHVVQQTDRLNMLGDVSQREADQVANAALHDDRIAITPTAPMIQRQLLSEGPSAETPNLSQDTVQLAHEAIARGDKQQAIDIIVNEMVRTGQIDRAKLLGGRVHYQPSLDGEGQTTRRGFRREPRTGELTALRRPVRIGDDAFRNLPWLYSSILHEYQHVLQVERPSGLRTIESVVPGQQSAKLYRMQRDVEAYATEILHAHETGVDRHPSDMRDLWERLHDAWSYLDPAKKQPLKDLYRQAHSRAESIPGVGGLTHFTPIP